MRAALTGLGYAPDEVRDVVAQLPEDGSVEDLLRDALKLLAVTHERERDERDELLRAVGRSGGGGGGDRRSGPAASTSSSASRG